MKFVYWFSFYHLNSPTVRYRGKYTTDYLQTHYGIKTRLVLPDHRISNMLRFIRIYLSALIFPPKGSLIVIQSVYRKSLYPFLLKILVKVRRKICFYDLDDADYLRYPPENIYYFIRNCSTVTVGSTELQKNMKKLNPSCELITCPTPDLNITKSKKNDHFTIGWIGDFQKTHKESLTQSFFPALKKLPFKARLVLMGVVKPEEHQFLQEYFAELPQITLVVPENIDWLNEPEIQKRIVEFDIGIATLLDDEFSRSKSAFKLKQCLNNGVPVLSSDIAENNLFIDNGKNGYLCSGPDDFLKRLVEFEEMNKENYAEFSKNARASIPRFNLQRFCDDLLRTYDIQVAKKHS